MKIWKHLGDAYVSTGETKYDKILKILKKICNDKKKISM